MLFNIFIGIFFLIKDWVLKVSVILYSGLFVYVYVVEI